MDGVFVGAAAVRLRCLSVGRGRYSSLDCKSSSDSCSMACDVSPDGFSMASEGCSEGSLRS